MAGAATEAATEAVKGKEAVQQVAAVRGEAEAARLEVQVEEEARARAETEEEARVGVEPALAASVREAA